MIDFANDISVDKEPVKEAKNFKFEESYAIYINLAAREQFEQYRASRVDDSRIYADVKIDISAGEIVTMTLDEFIRRIRQA